MKSSKRRNLWAVLLVAGLLAMMTLGSMAGGGEETETTKERQDLRIPEKPGGIPHGLDGLYATCSNCHELSIPPHPPLARNCLSCHTQAIDD